jgi:hypothetical protein
MGILISDHLSTSNIITLRRVSRLWWQFWGSEKIFTRHLKRHHRIFFETHGSSVFNGQFDDRILQQFEEFVLQQDAMQRGRYHSMAIYSYDDRDILPKTYHNGRVAWSIGATVSVTTLRTGVTKHYLNSDSAEVYNMWLHQDLLVVKLFGCVLSCVLLHYDV